MESNIKRELKSRYSVWSRTWPILLAVFLSSVITYDIYGTFVANRLLNTDQCYKEESLKSCADRVGIAKELFTYKNPYHAIITK
jgi:hypothetical protein